jgi:hypothetical protein
LESFADTGLAKTIRVEHTSTTPLRETNNHPLPSYHSNFSSAPLEANFIHELVDEEETSPVRLIKILAGRGVGN